jgi:hypothetical protein
MRPQAILCVLWLAGCDPGYSVVGRVSSADGGVVADVEISLACGDAGMLSGPTMTHTDDGGKFQLTGVGCIPTGCKLAVDGNRKVEPMGLRCHGRSFMCARTECSEATAELSR